VALQLFFLLRIALMAWSTRSPPPSSAARPGAAGDKQQVAWSQPGSDYDRISAHLKRAVIASEDAGFADHAGVDWDAIEKAWERNQRAEAAAERRTRQRRRASHRAAARRRPAEGQAGRRLDHHAAAGQEPAAVGRAHGAAQGAGVRADLDAGSLLSKRRILEIYLNNVEWGEGLFGAQAAARHYFRVDAARWPRCRRRGWR
jgi:monofunctional biosynthetic peptidoglycan transglycosylase